MTNKVGERIGLVAVIILFGTVGIALSTQGWRSRIPEYDLLTPIQSAQEFITSGRVPDRGVLTSFASYAPPGTVWLFVPGVLTFSDPRLFEFVGAGILFIGTLVGVFFLARSYFGVPCALVSVGVYSLSKLGLFYSASLWPRGHPFFYVWMAYWAKQWVTEKKARYLAAAIATWGVGMYVFMEIAPALLILPVLWFLYRPPISVRSLAVAGVAILALWYPYLRFEYARNFVDLRAQVSRQNALPANYRESWCDPHLVLRRREITASGISDRVIGVPSERDEKLQGGLRARLVSYWGRWNWIPANFEFTSKFPGNSLVLALLTLASLYLIGISPPSGLAKDQARRWRAGIAVLGATLIVFALACNEFVVARFASDDGVLDIATLRSIRWFQAVLITVGLSLVVLKVKLAESITRLRFSDNAKLFGVSLLVPWLVLLILLEDGTHLERFWWLWPLQVIALAALVTYIPAKLRLSSIVMWLGSACLAVMLLNPVTLVERIQRWGPGWSGIDAPEMRLADYMAQQVRGKTQTAIGYQIFNWPFMVAFNAVDPRYKVGAEFDLLYKTMHGFSNADQCAEGISSEDEFRIVQVSPTSDPREGYFDRPRETTFRLLHQFGPFQVFQRF